MRPLFGFGFITVFLSALAFARQGEPIPFSDLTFRVSGPNARAALVAAYADKVTALRWFEKSRKSIENFRIVDQGPRGVPRMTFTAIGEIGPVKMRFHVQGDVFQFPLQCDSGSIAGYRLDVDFAGSDSKLTENIVGLIIDTCVYEQSDGSVILEVSSHGTEGSDYGGISGKIARNVRENKPRNIMENIVTLAEKQPR